MHCFLGNLYITYTLYMIFPYIHSIPFHSIALHCIVLHYITLHYITLHTYGQTDRHTETTYIVYVTCIQYMVPIVFLCDNLAADRMSTLILWSFAIHGDVDKATSFFGIRNWPRTLQWFNIALENGHLIDDWPISNEGAASIHIYHWINGKSIIPFYTVNGKSIIPF